LGGGVAAQITASGVNSRAERRERQRFMVRVLS
jgi:hypothetical protein